MARQRVRLRLSKRGNLRFIGHRDLLRLMDRLFRRAALPTAMSEGFHPKPKVSYVSALALGFESDDEVMEVLLDRPTATGEILSRLNASAPEGLRFTAAEELTERGAKSAATAFRYEIAIPTERAAGLKERVAAILSAETIATVKANGKQVDLRPAIEELSFDGATLSVRLAVQSGPEAGVRELLVALGLEDALFRSLFPRRVQTILS